MGKTYADQRRADVTSLVAKALAEVVVSLDADPEIDRATVHGVARVAQSTAKKAKECAR